MGMQCFGALQKQDNSQIKKIGLANPISDWSLRNERFSTSKSNDSQMPFSYKYYSVVNCT